MRFTARARLETWAHASRVQDDEVTYGLLEHAADRAGDSAGSGERAGADGAGGVDVDAVEHAARTRGMEMMGPGKDVRATSAGLPAGYTPQDIVDLLLLTAGGNECSYAAQGAGEIERLREVVKACHQALFQAQEAAKMLFAKGEMLAAVVQGAKEDFVRVPYGASHEDVAAINDWHKMAAEALAKWENKA